jgi:hypothetical protein
VGDNAKVRSEAGQLAATIWANERIRALAENPLMLTTLLVVRRCIGELPNRRVELYREAVRVLIRTWNTEGFEPMDLEETAAQLAGSMPTRTGATGSSMRPRLFSWKRAARRLPRTGESITVATAWHVPALGGMLPPGTMVGGQACPIRQQHAYPLARESMPP